MGFWRLAFQQNSVQVTLKIPAPKSKNTAGDSLDVMLAQSGELLGACCVQDVEHREHAVDLHRLPVRLCSKKTQKEGISAGGAGRRPLQILDMGQTQNDGPKELTIDCAFRLYLRW